MTVEDAHLTYAFETILSHAWLHHAVLHAGNFNSHRVKWNTIRLTSKAKPLSSGLQNLTSAWVFDPNSFANSNPIQPFQITSLKNEISENQTGLSLRRPWVEKLVTLQQGVEPNRNVNRKRALTASFH